MVKFLCSISLCLGIDRLNLRALVDSSDHCRQYVQFDCFNTKFFDRYADQEYGASWFSTDGQQKGYWGGASKTTGCACSQTGSCHDSTKECNCDTGDNVWRRDAGKSRNLNYSMVENRVVPRSFLSRILSYV